MVGKSLILFALFVLPAVVSCGKLSGEQQRKPSPTKETAVPAKLDTATFGAGCFWCVEAIFQNVKGVYGVQSGYAGGHVDNPTYRQGNDSGPQYRSAIFYHTEEQHKLAEHYKKELGASGIFDAPIVTEITPYTNFFKAEAYHQNYFNDNGNQPYCRLVIQPKVEKFRKVFKEKLKAE